MLAISINISTFKNQEVIAWSTMSKQLAATNNANAAKTLPSLHNLNRMHLVLHHTGNAVYSSLIAVIRKDYL